VPVDRTLAEDLTRRLVELYADLEQQIVADIARRLKAGLRAPDDAGAKLASINDLRNAIQQLIRKLNTDSAGAVEQAVALAFARGGAAGLDELAKAGYLDARQLAAIRQSLPGAEAINRLAFALASTLLGTHVRILRWSLDAYRDVIATTALPKVLAGTTTRLAAAQHAWDRLLSQGVTGFVDKAGRRWELASYVEMATRTGVAQAAVQGHLDSLGAAGIDLVIVSDAPQECFRCRPWEAKVLDRIGPGGQHTVEVEHATIDGHMVRVEVAGSVVEAVAAGFLHPNCRHSINAYLPGITKIPTGTADPKGDEARQQLRALERKVRKAKTQAAGALDPAQRRAHEAQVRDLQGQIRDHIATAPTTLFRQRHREQIGAAR
jgi:DNA-binding transcriptional ArsR family regulator